MCRRLVEIAIVFLCLAPVAAAQPNSLRSGDLVLTRNADSVGNPNGYFNHVGIVVETPRRGLAVVEMQQEFDTAIAVTAEAFFRRYPEYMVVRYRNALVAGRAGRNAWAQIGVPRYAALASVKPCVRLGNKENCVSFVRHCYADAGLFDPKWVKPDAVYRRGGASGFRTVDHWRDVHYIVPDNFFEGRILP